MTVEGPRSFFPTIATYVPPFWFVFFTADDVGIRRWFWRIHERVDWG